MDKYEYKVCLDDIKSLIGRREYAQAMQIANEIDWTHVKSVRTLCMISDLYKINRGYRTARDVLLLAYRHDPDNPQTTPRILYSLCELELKLDEYVRALQFFQQYTSMAPRDPGRFILQYKLYEAQNVSLEERTAVLEELKKRVFKPRWVYELATLYDRRGLYSRCAELCDELVTNGDPKYVRKALELKKTHTPLTAEQLAAYGLAGGNVPGVTGAGQNSAAGAGRRGYGNPGQPQQPALTGVRTATPAGVRVQPVLPKDNALTGVTPEERPAAKPIDRERREKLANADMQETVTQGLREIMQAGTSQLPVAEMGPSPKPEAGAPEGLAEEATGQIAMRIDEPGRITQQTGNLDIGERGMHSWEELKAAAERRTEEESRRKIQDTTGPILARFEEEAKHGVLEDIELEADDRQRERRMREAKPEGGELPDGISRDERVQAAVSAQTPEKPADADNLVRDDSASGATRVWSGRDVEEATKKAEEGKHLTETQEIAELVRQEFENDEKEEKAESAEAAARAAAARKEEGDRLEEARRKKEEIAKARERAEELASVRETADAEALQPENIDAAAEGINAEEPAVAEEPVETPIKEPEEQETEEPEEKPAASCDTEAEDVEQSAEAETPEEEADLTDGETDAAGEDNEADEVNAANVSDAANEADAADAADADTEAKAGEEDLSAAKKKAIERSRKEAEKIRTMTPEQRRLFAPYLQERHTRSQVLNAIDSISLASYTGNVIITGEAGLNIEGLAKALLKDVRMSDSNFSGRVAVVHAAALNKRDPGALIDRLQNGGLIIEEAGSLTDAAAKKLHESLEKEECGIIMILTDTKSAMDHFLSQQAGIRENFTIRIDVLPLSDDELVRIATHYAKRQDCVIDDMAVLALHTRISSQQTPEHRVTSAEARAMVDEAIGFASKKSFAHLWDSIAHRRYDSDDRLILREKDFTHYSL